MPWTEGDLIRKLRIAFGWTLDDLRERSGVNPTVVSKIELGKTKEPKRDTLRKIAKAFGFSEQQFFAAVPAQQLELPIPAETIRLAGEVERAVKIPAPHAKARRKR